MASQYKLDIAYMKIAMAHAELSKGTRAKVGACLVTEHGVILGGCNGMAPGGSNTLEVMHNGELITKSEVIHAELSCILKAAKEGVSVVNSTLYVTLSCCLSCSEMITAAGVSRVVYLRPYRTLRGLQNLASHGVEVTKLEEMDNNE